MTASGRQAVAVRRRATLRRVTTALAVVAVTALPGGGRALADDGSAGADAGTVHRLDTDIPNYFYDHAADFHNTSGDGIPVVFSDPVNDYLYEAGTHLAYSWADASSPFATPSICRSPATDDGMNIPYLRLDPDTYTVLASGCGGTHPGGAAGNAGTKMPLVAIDSTDRLLFFASSPDVGGPNTDMIVAVSEQTLTPIATWPAPPIAPVAQAGTRAVYGLSWYAPTDELIVVMAVNSAELPGGRVAVPSVTVADYALHCAASAPATCDPALDDAAAGKPVTPAWTYQMPAQCPQPAGAYATFGTGSAYRSVTHPYLFVPCLQTVTAPDGAGTALIARLDLDDAGRPDGNVLYTEVPGRSDDFYFDAADDRGFMPYQNGQSSALMVYDGDLGRFVGQIGVGGRRAGEATNPDQNCTTYGVDPGTGRIYATSPTGLVVADGRTPTVEPGTNYRDLGGAVDYSTDATLPADAVFASPRFTVELVTRADGQPADCGTFTSEPGEGVHSFAVFEDETVGSSSGPAVADNPDANTYAGPIPPGADVAMTNNGVAEAAGVRAVFAGSSGHVTSNATLGFSPPLPMSGGTNIVYGGWVQQAVLQDSSTSAAATAVGDGNGTSTGDLVQCSDLQALGACSNAPSPPQGAPQPSDAMGQLPDSTQMWPFPLASCSQPGSSGSTQQVNQDNEIVVSGENVTANGAYATTSHDDQGDVSVQPIPNSDQAATASADCTAMPATKPAPPSPGVVASAQARALGLDGGQAGPAVAVGYASGVGQSFPAAAVGGQVVSAAAAVAEGVRIELPGGVEVDIGEVYQSASAAATGTAGGAAGRRLVQFSDVTVTTPQTPRQVLCDSHCSPESVDAMLSQLNQVAPGNFQAEVPQPDQSFGDEHPDSAAKDGSQVVPGSPGGYQAAIKSTSAEQAYDEDFDTIPSNFGESSMLPALRLTIYDDGFPWSTRTERSRQVIDLAPVEVQASNGILVLPSFGQNGGDTGSFGGGAGAGSGGSTGGSTSPTVIPARPGKVIPGQPARFVPGTPGRYVPGTPGHFVPGVPAANTTTAPLDNASGPPLLAPLERLFKRVLHGLSLALRSPTAALKLFGLLLLLLAPAVLMVRRQQWLRQVHGGVA